MNKLILVACIAITMCFACTKKENIDINQQNTGQVKLKFDLTVNNKKLFLQQSNYSNNSNENYTVDLVKFYISNIKFISKEGKTYIVPKSDSFFLIDASNSLSLTPTLQIPQGEYNSLEFNLGVDSLTNTLPSEQRVGVLDIGINGMYWEWNSGYIHFKIEGKSPQSTIANNIFKYHIGFYGGYNTPTVNNNRNIKIDLQSAGIAQVQNELSSDIHLMVDLGKIFDGPNQISIKNTPIVMTTGPHAKIADNYASMFTHDHTHNFQKIATK